jgi:hypothetical protein
MHVPHEPGNRYVGFRDIRLAAQHESDTIGFSIPLSGLVKELIKSLKRQRGWERPGTDWTTPVIPEIPCCCSWSPVNADMLIGVSWMVDVRFSAVTTTSAGAGIGSGGGGCDRLRGSRNSGEDRSHEHDERGDPGD